MCGILLVHSRDAIPLDKHLSALKTLKSRGPDLETYQYKNNIFIGQTLLHITGTQEFYHTPHSDFLAYNGEIYNYKSFGKYHNDVELVADVVPSKLSRFKQFEGMWAWAWTNFDTVLYATDPQGERVLYQYQDDDILIVASEVTAILEYIQPRHCVIPYENKCWTMLDQTPWAGIVRLEPGQLYRNGKKESELDSIWSWISAPTICTFDEAAEEFDSLWAWTCRLMTPTCDAALSYSGGLDSNLILNSIDHLELYAVNTTGKDDIIDNIDKFLTANEMIRLHLQNISPEQWGQAYQELIKQTKMPASSWSHVGKWLVAQQCRQRVLFTGLAADELFGGYGIYKTLEYNSSGSTSPYSSHDHAGLWDRCLTTYNGDAQQATLLMDYWYQVVGLDAPGMDRIAGAHGIETRNPFMSRRLMTFALNLPFEFKVNTQSKPLIRRAFMQRWPEELIYPKMGFAGHANDSIPYLDVVVKLTGDRHQDWKQVAQQTFYEYTA
jgi:asparagine synthetase B (glutamine-hydrolysing)